MHIGQKEKETNQLSSSGRLERGGALVIFPLPPFL
jgi:hypothetical protein